MTDSNEENSHFHSSLYYFYYISTNSFKVTSSLKNESLDKNNGATSLKINSVLLFFCIISIFFEFRHR